MNEILCTIGLILLSVFVTMVFPMIVLVFSFRGEKKEQRKEKVDEVIEN